MYRKIFAAFFTAVIIAAMGIAVVPDREEKENIKKVVQLDCSEQYPLPEPERHSETEAPETKQTGLLKLMANKVNRATISLKNWANTKERKIQNRVTENYKYRMDSVLLKNYYQKLLGMDITTSFGAENTLNDWYDIPVKYDEDGLVLGGVIDDIDISENVNKLIDFAEYVEDKNINFLYFHAPGKYASHTVYKDYSEQKEAELIKSLQDNNIDYIYFNDYMPKDRDQYAKMFYKTDVHWLTSTGLYANEILCKYLNENYGYNVDTSIFKPDNYEVKESELPFLGFWGRKGTQAYVKPEPFEIYYPKFKSDLGVYNTKYDENTNGDIAETLFNYDAVSTKDIYQRHNYSLYGLGDMALCNIHNNNINDGSHIMLIKISFADSMYTYLPAVFENIDVVDLRYFEGSIKAYIEKSKPDTIIVIYGTGSYESSQTDKLFDFR